MFNFIENLPYPSLRDLLHDLLHPPIKNSFDFFRGLSVVYKADRPCSRANRPWNTAESLGTSMAHLLVDTDNFGLSSKSLVGCHS